MSSHAIAVSGFSLSGLTLRSTRVKIAVSVAVAVLYAVAIVPIINLTTAVFAFSLVPVFTVAVLFGLRGAAIMSFASFAIHFAMALTLAEVSFADWVTQGGGLTAASLLIIGPMTGWLIDLTKRIRHDLVERERAEQALVESEELFRQMAENVQEWFWLSDLDARRVLYVNPAFEEITGWDRERLYEKPSSWIDFVHPDDRASVIGNFEKTRSGEGVNEGVEEEFRISKSDGSTRWIRSRSFPIANEEGHVYRVAGVVEDVTDRKAADEALAQTLEDLSISNKVLEKEIDERRRAEDSLQEYADDLARSNSELQEFAYIASHDLQEPMRMISSYTQLLQRRYKGQLDNDADEFIAYAVDGANRMQQFINDLLTYSRVGTKGTEFQRIDCHEVVTRAMANLKFAIEESGTRIDLDDLPTITADGGQLVQLFQNLIGNGIKFSRDEPPLIKVSATEDDAEWVLSVQDNGIGIEPDFYEQIFAVFRRLHTRDEYSGTGIGLAICKKIVARHKGRIWVDSTPGAGSTFNFSIPKDLGGD
jgi:PAS domain S-box-containing protein